MVGYIDTYSKILKFGYGGLHVRCDCNCIRFDEINPSIEVGAIWWYSDGVRTGNLCYTGRRLCIEFHSIDELDEFFRLLKNVDENCGREFTFDGVTFDFTAYNAKSVKVVRSAAKLVMNNLIGLLAC